MIIEISDRDLEVAAQLYHCVMVDQDKYTVAVVREALKAYVRTIVLHFIENVTEFEYDRPDGLEASLQAAAQASK